MPLFKQAASGSRKIEVIEGRKGVDRARLAKEESIRLPSLREKLDEFKWNEFFDKLYDIIDPRNKSRKSEIYGNTKTFLVDDLDVLVKKLKLFQNTELQTVVLAIWWVIYETIIENSPKSEEMFDSDLGLSRKPKAFTDRIRKCLRWNRRFFGHYIDHVAAISKKEEITQNKKMVNDMVTGIISTFSERFKSAEWTDKDTVKFNLDKLDQMKVAIGSLVGIEKSEVMNENYGQIDIVGKPFLEMLSILYRDEIKTNLKKLGDTTEEFWYMNVIGQWHRETHYDPLKHGIIVDPTTAHIIIPTTLLRYPFFNLGLPVLNYGSLGTYVASSIWFAMESEGCGLFGFDNAWTGTAREKFNIILSHFKYAKHDSNFNAHALYQIVHDIVGFEISYDAYKTVEPNLKDQWNTEKEKRIITSGLNSYLPRSNNNAPVELSLPSFRHNDNAQLFSISFANRFCWEKPSVTTETKNTKNQSGVYDENTRSKIQIHTDKQSRVDRIALISQYYRNFWKCEPWTAVCTTAIACNIWKSPPK